MTEETQALVDRLEQDAGILEQHGGFPTVAADVRDAAAALTTLARDYARTKEAAEVVYASSKANAEEVQRLSRDLETADKCNDILKGEVAAARQELNEARIKLAVYERGVNKSCSEARQIANRKTTK